MKRQPAVQWSGCSLCFHTTPRKRAILARMRRSDRVLRDLCLAQKACHGCVVPQLDASELLFDPKRTEPTHTAPPRGQSHPTRNIYPPNCTSPAASLLYYSCKHSDSKLAPVPLAFPVLAALRVSHPNRRLTFPSSPTPPPQPTPRPTCLPLQRVAPRKHHTFLVFAFRIRQPRSPLLLLHPVLPIFAISPLSVGCCAHCACLAILSHLSKHLTHTR